MNEAKFSDHARERCAEMGFSTKRAKRALREPGVTYGPDPDGGVIHVSHNDPEIAVVYKVVEPDGGVLVLSVLWHTQEQYCRPEAEEEESNA